MSMSREEQIQRAVFRETFGRSFVSAIPQLRRGRVWCTKCGASQGVSAVKCFKHGWPKCCGYTMTIDSPEERAARSPR